MELTACLYSESVNKWLWCRKHRDLWLWTFGWNQSNREYAFILQNEKKCAQIYVVRFNVMRFMQSARHFELVVVPQIDVVRFVLDILGKSKVEEMKNYSSTLYARPNLGQSECFLINNKETTNTHTHTQTSRQSKWNRKRRSWKTIVLSQQWVIVIFVFHSNRAFTVTPNQVNIRLKNSKKTKNEIIRCARTRCTHQNEKKKRRNNCYGISHSAIAMPLAV